MGNKSGGGANITVFMGVGIAAALLVIGILQNGQIGYFIDPSSIAIVIGGTIGAIVASYPMEDLKKIPTLIKFALNKSDANYMDQIRQIIDMANLARKNGVLALEDQMENINDSFIRNGIMMIVDGSDPELVKNMLNTQSYFTDERHARYISMFELGSSCAPAMGMAGTLIGLVNMLMNLTGDMSTIGPSMATALITTFYGVLLANLIFNPIVKQLQERNQDEMLCKDIIIEGILSIQDGENPRVIQSKLEAFIAETDLKAASAAGAGAGAGAGETAAA